MKRAAGVLLVAADTGRILLVRRSPRVDYAGFWTVPGGYRDHRDGTLLDTALRELHEETGYKGLYRIARSALMRLPQYVLYEGSVEQEFEPRLNWENDDYGWFEHRAGRMPSPLHPGIAMLFARRAN